MSEDMRELKDELVRYGALANVPPPELKPYCFDCAAVYEHWGVHNRCFFASYTPGGIWVLFQAFEWRMNATAPGDSKRAIKRDIQSNPHLHPKLKAALLKKLPKAKKVRYCGRGLMKLDREYQDRIHAMTNMRQAEVMREELESHPFMPEALRENLLFNLGVFEAEL